MDEFFAASAAGKALDASVVAAWASGHVGMQTWFGIAWELQLSFYLPAFARSEAMLLHPATEPLIELWPGPPTSCSQTWDPPRLRPSMPASRRRVSSIPSPAGSCTPVASGDGPPSQRTPDAFGASTQTRLHTTSPLAELILSRDLVWIRTADGTLYPAPKHPTLGLSWGYPGSGPAELAALIDCLLDDINAAALAPPGAPDGLEELTQMAWPNGTILTREQLEAARAGHPPHPPPTR